MSLLSALGRPVIAGLDWLVRNYSSDGWMLLGRDVKLALMRRDQRSVEYFWVTRALESGDRRILEVGSSGSWYAVYLARLGYEVWGMDLIDEGLRAKGFTFVQDDARTGARIPDGFFDVVISISVVEHIGLELQGVRTLVRDEDGDMKAAATMARKLKPGGTMLLTFPYGLGGIKEDQAARIYNADRLARLIDASGLKLVRSDFFRYNQDDLSNTLELTPQAEMDATGDFGSYAFGLACLHLQKLD